MDSLAPPSSNILRSPQQAANTFSQSGALPRQRNVFIVKFVPNGSLTDFTNLTFAVKSCDRPRNNPKTEELHQYNKKRQIYTGHKWEPVRMSFYDSADGAAQNMWLQYGRYYFGDLNDQTLVIGNSDNSYNYDVTTPTFNDFQNTGFGFTANNGGSTDINGQFFFDRVEIYHFYDGLFDCYYLIHPKISAYEPDDLDYANSDVATVNMTLAYEAAQYFIQQPVNGVEFDAFLEQFNGNPLIVPNSNFPTQTADISALSGVLPSLPSVASLLSSVTAGALGAVADYRYTDPSGGAIGIFGNFVFGPPAGPIAANNSLSRMSLSNPALAAALSINNVPSPLESSVPVLYNTVTSSNRGINGALFDVVNAKAQAASTGYGIANTTVSTALLASKAINGSGVAVNSSGQITLSPQGYGAINAQLTGTAQYGFNVQTDIEGNSWGFDGPEGFQGPSVSPQNPGPYSSDRPAGLYGRFVPPPPLTQPTFGSTT